MKLAMIFYSCVVWALSGSLQPPLLCSGGSASLQGNKDQRELVFSVYWFQISLHIGFMITAKQPSDKPSKPLIHLTAALADMADLALAIIYSK
jgi:hypothetical protein